MRIAIVCRTYPTQRPGGMPHVAQDRARSLAQAGHEVFVLTTGPDSSKSDEWGVSVRQVGCEPQQYSDLFAEGCRASVIRFRPDHVHCESYDRQRIWWPHDIPVSVALHGEEIGGEFTGYRVARHKGALDQFQVDHTSWSGSLRPLQKAGVRLVATCLWDQLMWLDLGQYPGVALVYNPIPPEFWRSRTPHSNSCRRAVFCALWGQSSRGMAVAQEACKLAGVELIKPRVPRAQLPGVYDMCKALLAPGLMSNGYDLVVTEALARRRPVLCAHNGMWTAEWQGGQQGLHPHTCGSIEELAEQLGGPLPEVPLDAVDQHKYEAHAKSFEEAVL